MPKTIVRPDSTTVMLEFPFHKIRNSKELKNVYDVASELSSLIILQRFTDIENFQPYVACMLNEPKSPFKHEFYIITFEQATDVGIDLYTWDKLEEKEKENA